MSSITTVCSIRTTQLSPAGTGGQQRTVLTRTDDGPMASQRRRTWWAKPRRHEDEENLLKNLSFGEISKLTGSVRDKNNYYP